MINRKPRALFVQGIAYAMFPAMGVVRPNGASNLNNQSGLLNGM